MFYQYKKKKIQLNICFIDVKKIQLNIMDTLLIFYFFILLIFLKSINIDFRLIIFIVICAMFYLYNTSKTENINNKLESSSKDPKIYNFGNKIKEMNVLNDQNFREITGLKQKIYSMKIQRNDKIEIYILIKKYFVIYNNYSNYDYKHNWINDLHYNEVKINNKISSLNISYEDLEEEISDLFNEVSKLINSVKSELNNYHVYNNLNHPSGFDKNIPNSYLF